jgi:hypothetical protein
MKNLHEVEEALTRLAAIDPKCRTVIEMRVLADGRQQTGILPGAGCKGNWLGLLEESGSRGLFHK